MARAPDAVVDADTAGIDTAGMSSGSLWGGFLLNRPVGLVKKTNNGTSREPAESDIRQEGSMKQFKDRVLARLYMRYPSLLKRWARKARIVSYSESPWTDFTGSLARSRLALVTTGGIYLKTQPPFDMQARDGDPTFREIPAEATKTDLAISHAYYDSRDANSDINIVFPIDRVRELAQFGEIGNVNHRHFSFMGHITERQIDTLINMTAPQVADLLDEDGVDIALLTPA